MEGTPVHNKCPTMRPLKVAHAHGRIVTSTHMCDITIDSLPVTLTGHIIPDLSIGLLFGIRVPTEAGCNVNVTFTRQECIVRYNGKIILRGAKDPTKDLWTLPLGSQGMTSQFPIGKLPPAAPFLPMPMPTLHRKLRFLHTPSEQKPIASDLLTSPCAAHLSHLCSRQSSGGTSKGAQT